MPAFSRLVNDHDEVATFDLGGLADGYALDLPSLVAEMEASIFMASMTATWSLGLDLVASLHGGVDHARERRGHVAVVDGSAFSTVATEDSTLLSRTFIGRIWPLTLSTTLRMPFSSGSPRASRRSVIVLRSARSLEPSGK